MTPDEARQLITDIRRTRAETEGIEVKTAQGGTPFRPLREAMSAFANRTGGGVIVLGIDERLDFAPVGVHDAQKVKTDIVGIATDDITPPFRPSVTFIEVDGKPIVIAEIPEVLQAQKPCYISAGGMQGGSFIRVGPSNRQMTTYEVFTHLNFREQHAFDREIVREADITALDRRRIDTFILRLQTISRRSYVGVDYAEAIERLAIARVDDNVLRPTLAGLICFGEYSQQFRPQLRIVFTEYYGETESARDPGGARFVNDMEFDGPVEEMVDSAVMAVMLVLPSPLYVTDVLHRRETLFPRAAIREAIVNAVAHRDYSGFMTGSAVQIRLFSDRLEIRSPGGLYGGIRIDGLSDQQSTRNEHLMRFLQDLSLVENRGYGIDEMTRACQEYGLPAPEFNATSTWFQVTFRKPARTDPITSIREDRGVDAYDTRPVRDSDLVLGLIAKNGQVTNSDLRELLGLERWQATRLLQRMAARGVIVKHGDRRGVYYTRS